MDAESIRKIASQALALTAQDWTSLGFGEDPQVAPSNDVEVISDRIAALLAIRSVATLSTLEHFRDFSTTTICRTLLLNSFPPFWPKALTSAIIQELRAYVRLIITGYNDTPYHNREHAYHVTLSANKLLDLMLNSDMDDNLIERVSKPVSGSNNKTFKPQGDLPNIGVNQQQKVVPQRPSKIPKTFGLRRDTLLQFTLIFSALIHDVQHTGISNRQLSLESDPLALLYNDSSVLENQSITVAFTELLQPDFANFRNTIFPNRDLYSAFRKNVITLILATDIASPERMQITKDKWKEAFGDIDQNHEEKVRRDSEITEITLTGPSTPGVRDSRRRSIGSVFSDLTVDLNTPATPGGEETSLLGSPDSSENDTDGGDIASNALSESVDGADTIETDRNSRCSYPRSQSAGSVGAVSLEKIEEFDGTGVQADSKNFSKDDINNVSVTDMNSHTLGYSTFSKGKQNGNRIPPPEGGNTHRKSQQTAKVSCSNRGHDGNLEMTQHRPGGTHRRRRASMTAGDDHMKRMQRRLSASSAKTTGDSSLKKYRQRLGIMRSLDLGGETIENFSRKGSISARTASSRGLSICQSNFPFEEYDQPDELKATVVLETLLLGSDVAHNLQSWDHMLKWSQNLYWELTSANDAGRGFDPSPGWKAGQSSFLQGYMLPLAQKLGATGVFGNRNGFMFTHVVQDIHGQWEIHGEDVTAKMKSSREANLHEEFARKNLSVLALNKN